MHSARIPIIGVFILVNVILILGVSALFSHVNTSHAVAYGQIQVAQAHTVRASGQHVPIAGTPAIAPHSTGTPAFSSSDVRQYVVTHQFSGGPTVAQSSPSIVKLEFISSKQASQQLDGTSPGLPDNALVCFVVIKGPFLLTADSQPSRLRVPTVNTGIEVFDAHTGNQLVWAVAP